MSLENVELMRRGAAVFTREGVDAWLRGFVAPDAVFVQDASVSPEARTWHGHAGWRAAIAEWTAEFDEWNVEVQDVLDAGDGRVVLAFSDAGRGARSGIRVGRQGSGFVHTLRDGLIVHSVQYNRLEDALAAVGLQP